MKFTVLGSSGFIGRHLVTHLHASGHDVFIPDRNDPAIYKQPLGHVIYCVGLTADFRKRPFDTVYAHICLLAQLLEKASFLSLLYLSSTRVYAGATSGDEQASLLAGDLYNVSKLTGESLCFASGREIVRVVRLSNVVGAVDADSDNFLFALAREAKAGKIILQVQPASAKDYIHVDDVVQMLP
jgi:nucleoside-diphosphate-sugar epimerase